MGETARPGEDGGDRVGGGGVALLVLAVMTSDGAVGGLRLDGLAIGSHENGGHETERAVSLGDNVGLDVAIVVFAGPDEAAIGFDGEGNHVIDETMLVPETLSLELDLVLLVVDFLEDVLEAAIVLFEDGVLGGQVARHVDLE